MVMTMTNREANIEPMSEERLREIEEREQAATAGPWLVVPRPGSFVGAGVVTHSSSALCLEVPVPVAGRASADCRFIAGSRQDVPDLLAEVRRLQIENGRLREMVSALNDWAWGTDRYAVEPNRDGTAYVYADNEDGDRVVCVHIAPTFADAALWVMAQEATDAEP